MAINKEKVMEAARKARDKGQVDKAIKEYLRIVQEDPQDVRIWLKIGDLYAKKESKSEAAETYGKVAKFYSDQGFFLKAVAVYKQILKLDPTLMDINLRLAELYRQLGLLSDAMQHFELVAAHYHAQGKIKEALSTVRQMVDLDPENVATRIKLAELYSKENLTSDAVNEFGLAAEYLRKNGRTEDFIKVAERLLWHKADNLPLNRELAALYLKRNDPRHALQKLQVCFKADARDVETLSMLSQAFQALDQKAKAVSVLKEMARVLSETGKRPQAEETYRRVLALAPDDADAKTFLGAGAGKSVAMPAPTPPGDSKLAKPAPAAPGAESKAGKPPVRPETAPGRAELPPRAPTAAPDRRPPGGPAAPPPGAAPAVASNLSRPAPAAPVPSPAPRAATASPISARSEPGVRLQGTRSEANGRDARPSPIAVRPSERMPMAHAPAAKVEAPKAAPKVDRTEEINKILAESDVYLKYGLHQKAVDHLRKVFEIEPHHISAHERLKDVYLAQGREPDAIGQLVKLATILANKDREKATEYLREAFSLDASDARVQQAGQSLNIELGAEGLGGTSGALSLSPPDVSEVSFDDLESDSALDVAEMSASTEMPARASAPRLHTFDSVELELDTDSAAAGNDELSLDAGHNHTGEVLDSHAAGLELVGNDDFDALGDADPDELQPRPTGSHASLGDALSRKHNDSLGGPMGGPLGGLDDFDPDLLNVDPNEFAFDADDAKAFDRDLRRQGTSADGSLSTEIEHETELEGEEVSLVSERRAQLAGNAESKISTDVEHLPYTSGPADATDYEEAKPFAADSTDSPFSLPLEDEVSAALFAGSPARVTEESLQGPDKVAHGSSGTRKTPVPEDSIQTAASAVSLEDELDEADFFASQGLLEEAKDILNGLLERHPGHPLLLAKLADIGAASAEDTGITDEPLDDGAVPVAAKADSHSGANRPVEDAETHFDVGLAYKEMGIYDEAIKAFQKILAVPGREVQCHLMIGLCHREQGSLSEAINQFKSGLYVESISVAEKFGLYYEIGTCYEELNDPPEALYYYEMVLKKDPAYRDVAGRVQRLKSGESPTANRAPTMEADADSILDQIMLEDAT